MPSKKDEQKVLEDDEIAELSGGGPGIIDIGRRVHTLMAEHPTEAPKTPSRPEHAPEHRDVMESGTKGGASALQVKAPSTRESAEAELKALGAALESPATQEASLSKFALARKLLGVAGDMMGKPPLDAGFAAKFERTLQHSSDQIAQLPDFYNVDGQMRDARPRKDAVMKGMEQLTGLFNALKDNSVGGLIKLGIGAALNLDGTLNQVLLPFVSAFSQFRAESKLPPMQQKAVEREATQSLVDFLKKLPFAIATRPELENFAKKIGVPLTEENQGELAARFRTSELARESAALKASFQKMGLTPETTELITQALASPLDAGTRAAPLALADVARGVSDPYNQVLIGHMLDLAAQVAPMFVPAKGKPITLLSGDAQKALGTIAETQPGLQAGLARVQSDRVQAKIQKKLEKATTILPAVADVLKKADLGSTATEATRTRLAAQRDTISRNLAKAASEKFSPSLEQAAAQNKFARLMTAIASTLTGRQNPLDTARKLTEQMARGNIDPTDFYNQISRLREKSPSWLRNTLQGMMGELAGTRAKDVETAGSTGKIDEPNLSLRRAGQNAAIDILKDELAQAETARGKGFDAFDHEFWDGIKASGVTGFTAGDKEKLQNWLARFQVQQQVAFREAMSVINDSTKSPEERMKAVSAALAQATEGAQTLQDLRASFSEINDANYRQIMGTAAEKLGVPANELPEKIKAAAATGKVATADALKSIGELSTDPSQRLEQLKTARDQLKRKITSDEMWGKQKLSNVLGYTKKEQQALRRLTEKLTSNLSSVNTAKQSLKALEAERNPSAGAAPADFASVEEEFRALKQLERNLQFVGDESYEGTAASLRDQVKNTDLQLVQLEKLQLEAARSISDPSRQTEVLRGLRNVASSALQSDALWNGLNTSGTFGFTAADRDEIRSHVKGATANSEQIAQTLRNLPEGLDKEAREAVAAKTNAALAAEVQRLHKLTALVRGVNDETYKSVKSSAMSEKTDSSQVLAGLKAFAAQQRV